MSCLRLGALGLLRLRDALAQRPQGRALGRAAGDHGVDAPGPCSKAAARAVLQRGRRASSARRRPARPGRTRGATPRNGSRGAGRCASTRSSACRVISSQPVSRLAGRARAAAAAGRPRPSTSRAARASAVARRGVAGNSCSTAAVMTPERALGADEELLQVVAGVVLAQRPQPVPHPAVGQHHLEPEHQVAHHAVAQHRRAAGVGREVAADGAGALGAERQREQPARGRGGVLHGRPAPTPASTVIVSAIGVDARGSGASAPATARPASPDASGTAPPQSPVLPPCGTSATPASPHSRTAAATSAVSAGRSTAAAAPR